MKTLLKKGFTIVELVIVIAVIAILAGVLIPTFSGVVSKANQSAALTTARNTLQNALAMSSNAQLAGQDESGTYRTVFIVDGYAFGYTGNQLVQIDYPQGANKLKVGVNFNAIMISEANLTKSNNSSYNGIDTIIDTKYLQLASDIPATKTFTNTDGNCSLSWVVEENAKTVNVYYNSEFPKNVVVFTTVG